MRNSALPNVVSEGVMSNAQSAMDIGLGRSTEEMPIGGLRETTRMAADSS